MNGNCDVLFPLFQIQQGNEEIKPQQDIEINFERLADLISADVISMLETMFWRGVSNPQSGPGELEDSSDQIYDL